MSHLVDIKTFSTIYSTIFRFYKLQIITSITFYNHNKHFDHNKRSAFLQTVQNIATLRRLLKITAVRWAMNFKYKYLHYSLFFIPNLMTKSYKATWIAGVAINFKSKLVSSTHFLWFHLDMSSHLNLILLSLTKYLGMEFLFV